MTIGAVGVPGAAAVAGRAANAGGATDAEKLDEAARGLEAIFLQALMQSMRKSVPEADLLHGGHGEATWREQLDRQLVQAAVENDRGFGIREAVVKLIERERAPKLDLVG